MKNMKKFKKYLLGEVMLKGLKILVIIYQNKKIILAWLLMRLKILKILLLIQNKLFVIALVILKINSKLIKNRML